MRIEVETNSFHRVTKWHIRRVLKSFSQHDLEGLQSIKVIDECPDDPDYVKLPRYLMGFLYNGHYSRKTKDRPAQVVLYAGDIYYAIPKLMMASPMTTLRLARTLAHEVGHHVIATRGYIYNPWEKYKPWEGIRDPYEEAMANAYASDLIERMLRHWPYKFGKLMARKALDLPVQSGASGLLGRELSVVGVIVLPRQPPQPGERGRWPVLQTCHGETENSKSLTAERG